MASRESSPESSVSGNSSPLLLTPNSKIKFLLAPLNETYSYPSNDSARDVFLNNIADPISFKTESLNTVESNDLNNEEPTVDDKNEGDFVRPNDQITASMQVRIEPGNIQATDSRSPEGGNRQTMSQKTQLSDKSIGCDISEDGNNFPTGPITPKNSKRRIRYHNSPKSSSSRNRDSPSLFLSPQKFSSPNNAQSPDSDLLPEKLSKNSRFMALIKKKRAELSMQTEAAEQKKQEMNRQKTIQCSLDNHTDSDDSNGESGDNLTLSSRPLRKASKKALEEMNRETQRLIRQQQLVHKPEIKKKLTKESLFSKFDQNLYPGTSNFRPNSSSSAAYRSDVETNETPPTSPPRHDTNLPSKCPEFPNDECKEQKYSGNSETSKELLIDKPKFLPLAQSNEEKNLKNPTNLSRPRRPNKVDFIKANITRQRPIEFADRLKLADGESDSELEIINTKPSLKKRLNSIFDQAPIKQACQANGFHALKMLAQIESPQKQNINTKPLSTVELQLSLQQRARKQAALERLEREQSLKAKGINIQTNEENERDQAELDDLLSKARAEAEEIRKQEQAAMKKNHKQESTSDDDDLDDDYGEKDKDIDSESFASSTSDDSDTNSLSGMDDCTTTASAEKNVISNEKNLDTFSVAPEPKYDEITTEDHDADTESAEESERGKHRDNTPVIRRRRQARGRNIIPDDEEESVSLDQKVTPSRQGNPVSQNFRSLPSATPTSVLRSATKNFIPGLPVHGPAGIGLTQIFTGTMDESDVVYSPLSPKARSSNNPVNILRQQTCPSLPSSPKMNDESHPYRTSQPSHISDSRAQEMHSQDFQLSLPLSQGSSDENLFHDSPVSKLPDLTQDTGFAELSPIIKRFDRKLLSRIHSTTFDTKKNKKKIYQKALPLPEISVEKVTKKEAGLVVSTKSQKELSDVGTNVFDVMSKGVMRKTHMSTEFNKTNGKVKEMFHEQAEESDDEYAGLGGASDDESESGEDEYVRNMIDDENENAVDAAEIARLHAHREREDDEKRVEKLYNDITKGMLRRKRGADYELSDSDDGGEARRRRKRQEFAKMRKALLADERINKLANEPKSQAFLRAIEDRASSDEELDFIGDSQSQIENNFPQSQSQSQSEVVSHHVTTSLDSPGKTKFNEISETGTQSGPRLRHPTSCKKPSNLSEIRHTLSILLDEPDPLESTEIILDSDSEESEESTRFDETSHTVNSGSNNGFVPRKNRPAVIDRITAKRNASAPSKASQSQQAFALSTSANGFVIPPLLRRATGNSINSSVTSDTSTSVSSKGVLGTESQGVKRGGAWGSGVNYFARENERRAKLIKIETRREQKLAKIAMSRRKFVDTLLGSGAFE